MPTLSDRLPTNTVGAYYVDATCIDCDLCRTTAPDLFGRDDETAMSFVRKQPVTPEEIASMDQAISECATSSIGSDGA